MLDYRSPETTRDERTRKVAKVKSFLKWTMLVLSIAVLVPFVAIALPMWLEWRTDEQVRQWMEGPRTDPVTLIHLSGARPSGPMRVTIENAESLNYVNNALPGASSDFLSGNHQLINIEIHFKSGRIVKAEGQVAANALAIQLPWRYQDDGNWHPLTIECVADAPQSLIDALSFAEQSSGIRKF